jgi:hypothetical protein
MKLKDYLPEFFKVVEEQIEKDEQRWGDTWKQRPREGQEERGYARFIDYFDQFKNGGTPIPWMKIVGEALITWVRENYPDYKEK